MDDLFRDVKCEYIGAQEVAERRYKILEAYQRADGRGMAYDEIKEAISTKLRETAEQPTPEQEAFLNQMSQWERKANREYKSTANDLQVYQRAVGAMIKLTLKPKPIYEFYLRHRTWAHIGFDQRDCEALMISAIAIRTNQIIPHHRFMHANDIAEWMKPYEQGPIEYDAVVSGDFYVTAKDDERARLMAAAFAGEEA